MSSIINVPQALKDLPGWLVWKFEENGTSKPRKVPYYARGGRRHGVQGRPEDRAQLVTFSEALAAKEKRGCSGVGFAPMAEFNVVALDFDNCVDGDGQIHADVGAVLGSSYAELSPSGKGIRALFKGQLGDLKAHGEPFGFETFSTKGFVTITGNVLPACDLLGNSDTVADITPEVRELCAKRFKRELAAQVMHEANEQPVGLTLPQLAECLDVLPTDLDYDKWVQVGMAIHHETQGEGFDLFDEWSQRSPKYTDRDYSIEKWNSFGKGSGRVVTARTLVKMANENGAHINLNGPASMEEFDAIAEAPTINDEFPDEGTAPVVKKQHRFPVLSLTEFASKPAPRYIVKGVLPMAELVVLYGESGSGKTFMALDLAMAITTGQPWRGRKVKQGRVVYIAAEGAGGFRNRIQAYATDKQLDLSGLDFGVIHAAPNFLLKEDALDVARSIGKASVIVVDTWAQTTPGGNENSGEDMGKALAHCKGLHRATGAVVILVHHAGKDASKGARGWSGLRAAADAELEVVRSGDARAMRLSKQKDGEDNTVWGFALETVNIGIDEDDEVITSCVVRETEGGLPGPSKVRRDLGEVEQIVNDVVQEFAKDQTSGIEVGEVLKAAALKLPAPMDGKRDTRKQRAERALKALCKGDDSPYFWEDGCLSIV
ncbi:Primase, C-terminal 2 [uncultured Caudovirales phage]|uniref:Primase, C-terminal 2 n=1 Tax=uncultured Caudovirales phage TaxID=2100421 RepID=A0A6J5KTD3_9CAUD|nr:Primase, C-terminal 2 [uncultured Caudovirales phage]